MLLAGVIVWGWLYGRMYRANGEIVSSGEKRSYLLYVPDSYDPAKPAPLVITLHGFAGWPEQIMNMSRWNKLADENGFIVVYPRGTGLPMRWRAHGRFGLDSSSPADAIFLSELIDKLQAQYNIDPASIYANGFSNGGGMAFDLSCQLSERIAAFGGVAGAYTMPWEECQPARPAPAILFHGDADQVVPYYGGASSDPAGMIFPSAQDWAAALAERNGCDSQPVTLAVAGDASGQSYSNCSAGADVILYTIDNGGHTWPGDPQGDNPMVGHASMDIDATRLMWAFFQKHPLR